MALDFEYIRTNGIRLHTALAGPDKGEPVILLHGFPEAWFGWEAQIRPLAEAGFRVVVPDQRGYNLSDKPSSVADYRMDILVADILGLADTCGYRRFHLAGHDFGALVGWHLAMRYPERLKRLAILNVPHPRVLRTYLRAHPGQMLRSWYVFFFQLPVLPERVLRARNWRRLITEMPRLLTSEQRDRYREAWDQPHAITSMVNWYRSYLRHPGDSTPSSEIQVPTLIVWGKHDRYLSYAMAPRSAELCELGRLVTLEDATHWVLHDKPGEVSQYLVQHFQTTGV